MSVLLVHALYDLILAVGIYGLSYLLERPIREGVGPETALVAVVFCRVMAALLGALSVLWFLLYLFW